MEEVLKGLDGFIPEKVPESGCKGYKYFTDCGYEFDCGYDTTIECEECKYGSCGGRKNPEAKINQQK